MKRLFIILVCLMFVTCLVGCNNTKNSQLNKDDLKQELELYIDRIHKAKTIQLNLSSIYDFIDEKVNSINEDDYKNKSLEIKNSIKEEINDLVLTKALEDEMIADFEKYDKYKNSGQIGHDSICYGIYNGAVVVLLVLPADIIGHIKINDFDFIYPSDFVILVWKDHKFYSFGIDEDVNALLDNHILSMGDIATIHKIHNESINEWKDRCGIK